MLGIIRLFVLSEINRIQSGKAGRSSSASGSTSAAAFDVGCSGGYRDPIKYVDVYRERPIRLTVRVLVPVREHPKVRVKLLKIHN